MDSTSALGVAARTGPGKLRHIAVRELWLQDEVRAHRIFCHYLAGGVNVSDALTKALPAPLFRRWRHQLGVRPMSSLFEGEQLVGSVESLDLVCAGSDPHWSPPFGWLQDRVTLSWYAVGIVLLLALHGAWDLVSQVCRCISRRCCRRVSTRTVATQSQTTYTALRGTASEPTAHPRFLPLSDAMTGVFD